jgi:UDP-2,3-diacylglucosamine hydrolase
MSSQTALFISDAHFGIPIYGDIERERYFADLLENFPSELSDLFIIGDLFDFWIEYRYAIRSDYFTVLHTLKKIVDKGINIHYLAGNHDFALGSFLRDVIGINIQHDVYNLTIQGKKVHLFHGDGLIKQDIGYRILKSILRNKFNQKLYKILHPDFGVQLGSFFSGSSRKYLRRNIPQWIIEEYRDHAKKTLDQGFDIVVYGHTHIGELCKFESGIYLNTGSWLINHHYATMTDGELALWSYQPGSAPQQLSPINLK